MRDPNERPSTADLAYGNTDGSGDTEREPEMKTAQGNGDIQMPLMTEDRTREYSSRWKEVQTDFVDEPRKAVEAADGLVAEVIQTLATTFADQRSSLEDQWGQGSEVSTEDLRQALMQYRSFFQRLLAA
jgi:hypothetical protein